MSKAAWQALALLFGFTSVGATLAAVLSVRERTVLEVEIQNLKNAPKPRETVIERVKYLPCQRQQQPRIRENSTHTVESVQMAPDVKCVGGVLVYRGSNGELVSDGVRCGN